MAQQTSREQVAEMRRRASSLYHDKQYAEAEPLYRQLVDIPGWEAEGYYGLGMLAVAALNFGIAEERLQHAILLDPKHHRARSALGIIARKRNDTAEARRQFEAAATLGNQGAARELRLLDHQTATQGRGSPPRSEPAPQQATPRPGPGSAALAAQRQVPEPFPPEARGRGRTRIEGTVRYFGQRQLPPQARGQPPVLIWRFRVNVETGGGRVLQAQVEMRSWYFKSEIRDGDEVTLVGKWNRSGLFIATRAYNNGTKSQVLGRRL
ncbi:tetratricopeptide repeat protein [Streptomyces sp. NPDC050546]|uniref:tetratricopeptide repeat protein n=1 Tax=Streptomyces sp. NPDC050546 TaxID=3365628 RepID=UPI0037B33667